MHSIKFPLCIRFRFGISKCLTMTDQSRSSHTMQLEDASNSDPNGLRALINAQNATGFVYRLEECMGRDNDYRKICLQAQTDILTTVSSLFASRQPIRWPWHQCLV